MEEFDICICGAGPTGSTTAYYLAMMSKKHNLNLKIGLLDKAKFPRDKFCGDAWCAPALDILEDMGVLQDLQKRGLVSETLVGGFVSPLGHSFIANDSDAPAPEKNMSTRAYAIKRMICDEAIAMKAKEVGCTLKENCLVEDAVLNESEGTWTVYVAGGQRIKCKILVAADGAASNIARKLGVVTTPPDGVAARQYIKGGTHNFKADGVLLYPEYTLPGYMALFRHYDDSIDLGAYLLPGGVAKEEDIADIYSRKIRTDPFISRALGPKWEPLERVKVASLRLGGIRQSYMERFFIVGDAAGQVDPLTGEGIHTGMIAGRICAETIVEMFQLNDFSIKFGEIYHNRWWKEFGSDFPISSAAARFVYKVPWLMDAVPLAAAAKGTGKAATNFFADFGAVMTGVKPKTTFLLPWVALPLAKSTLGVALRKLLGWERDYYQDPYGEHLKKDSKRLTSWDAQCLIDPAVPVGKDETDEDRLDRMIQEMFTWNRPLAKDRLPVLVVYGTEYGFSSELAKKLCDRLDSTGRFQPRRIDLAHYSLIDFAKERFVFVICSTAGDGAPPVETADFFSKFIDNPAVTFKPNQLYCAVLAPGDSAYPNFCAAGRRIAQGLIDKNCNSIFMNDSSSSFCQDLDGDNSQVYLDWMDRVVKSSVDVARKLSASFAPWIQSLVDESPDDYLILKARQSGGTLLKEKRATKFEPFIARVKSRRKLTNHPPCGPFEDKWHIVLDVTGSDKLLSYQPGDALGVLPENDPEEVQRLMMRLFPDAKPSEVEDQYISLLLSKNIKDSSPQIMQIIANRSDTPTDEWNERWISDVMDDYARPGTVDGNTLLANLKDLQPRFYSICSSPIADLNEIHLCVAAVRYEVRNRVVGGVASTFLIDRLQVGDRVPVFVQRNPDFRLPSPTTEEENRVIRKIMIGPGTGVAPFRSFARHEQHLKASSPKETVPPSLLFFGCRYEKGDFLYSDELVQYPYKLQTAFSRDSDRKTYVQHKLADMDVEIWRDFLSYGKDCQVYICGDGWKMAKDVEEALVVIAHKHGAFVSRESAQQYIKSMLHLDVWVV